MPKIKKNALFISVNKYCAFQDYKQVYITSGNRVLNAGIGPSMGRCNHEEADTRILVHILHALQY